MDALYCQLKFPILLYIGGFLCTPPYQIIPSARKTIAIQITPKGQVLVRCPNRMPADEIHRFVESKSSWIEQHLLRLRKSPPEPPFTENQLRDLARQAAIRIPKRVAWFAEKAGVTYGRITIRRQRTRWGSCSSNGNLNFNCLLMLVPPAVLDYVVVHELCHRKEMNHSEKFWAQVQKVLPNYEVSQKWLNDYGASLIARLEPGKSH